MGGVQIHSAVHKARPDIHGACRAHGIYGRAWSTFGKPLDMLVQHSCLFYKSRSVYQNLVESYSIVPRLRDW